MTTPKKDAARKAAEQCFKAHPGVGLLTMNVNTLARLLRAAKRAGAREEREACVAIVVRATPVNAATNGVVRQIYDAIRARGSRR